MSNTALHLMFHYLHATRDDLPFTRSVAAFEAQLRGLLDEGLKPASLADYPGEPPGPGQFTVSFDDAHRSVLELAAPVLQRLAIPATLFVPTAAIGTTDWALSPAELRELRTRGWTLGAHGHQHRRASWRLYDESVEQRRARLTADVHQCCDSLERMTGARPTLLAYPYGEAPSDAGSVLQGTGILAAFTVAEGSDWDGDLLHIPRLDAVPPATEPSAEPPGISVVVPACDRVPVLREVVRRLEQQSYPAQRYEVLVIDDGSATDLATALEEWPDVRVLRLPDSDRTFRAGQARQLGADRARFDVVAFLDADVAVDRDYLWALAWCHGRDPDAVVLGYLSGYNLHDLGHLHELSSVGQSERLCGDALPIIPDRSREPSFAACLDNLAWLERPWELCYTGNLSLRRATLARAGGFASAFTGWGFEDVDLGIRLHRAQGRFTLSRWALGYHIADPDELESTAQPNNPFRRARPRIEDFAGAQQNLDTLAQLHANDPGVLAFVQSVRADIDETCSQPHTVGVEVGAPLAQPWPYAPLHKAWPGGRALIDIADRLAYAQKVGAQDLYLLGGDVLLHPELTDLLQRARAAVPGRLTAETWALSLPDNTSWRQLDGVVVELLVGAGYPHADGLALRSKHLATLRSAGLTTRAKLVVDADDPDAMQRALAWCAAEGLPIDDVHRLHEPT